MSTIGCYSTRNFVTEERDKIKDFQKIYKIEMLDGRVIRFDSDPLGYAMLRDTTIERHSADGSIQLIPLAEIKTIHTKQFDWIATSFFVALGAGAAVLLYLLRYSGLKVG